MLKIFDFAERGLVVLLSIPFIIAFAKVLPTHPYYLFLAVSELLVVALMLIRRPGEMALTPLAFTVAIGGTAMPLLIRPTGGIELAPTVVTSSVMFAGLVMTVAAKLFLNRSFGMVAANRGVKRGGPYMLVRHPMYLGYMISQIGFLMAVFSGLNLAFYMVAWTFQILRIVQEEKILMADVEYVDFAGSTRWRLVPGLF